ncbi:hypothetical protein K9L05_02070, partial [Candidatus Babeliales bacterium]|nr:hypothetical protein [Candidatus Babeliales bacterium]
NADVKAALFTAVKGDEGKVTGFTANVTKEEDVKPLVEKANKALVEKIFASAANAFDTEINKEDGVLKKYKKAQEEAFNKKHKKEEPKK